MKDMKELREILKSIQLALNLGRITDAEFLVNLLLKKTEEIGNGKAKKIK